MTPETTLFFILMSALLFSLACMILFNPTNPDIPRGYVYPVENTTVLTENATTPTTPEHDEMDNIKLQFNATGEAVIERYIYNQTIDVCWRFTREFRKYNPEWSELTLGTGDAFGKCPHSVAYLRRNATSAYVHDAWGGDTFIIEFDSSGNFTMWNRIENGSKIFDTRNADWLKQYDHFNFGSNDAPTTSKPLRQDNRMNFIEGEI